MQIERQGQDIVVTYTEEKTKTIRDLNRAIQELELFFSKNRDAIEQYEKKKELYDALVAFRDGN